MGEKSKTTIAYKSIPSSLAIITAAFSPTINLWNSQPEVILLFSVLATDAVLYVLAPTLDGQTLRSEKEPVSNDT
jgi:hypothetical protein